MDMKHWVGSGSLQTLKVLPTRSPYTGPTTQPLYQDAESRKNETRRAAQHINALRSAGPWILIPRADISLFPLQSCDKTCNSSHVPILSMLCTLINFNASDNNWLVIVLVIFTYEISASWQYIKTINIQQGLYLIHQNLLHILQAT